MYHTVVWFEAGSEHFQAEPKNVTFYKWSKVTQKRRSDSVKIPNMQSLQRN